MVESPAIRSWHVSTSSWLHGARLLVSCGEMHKTSLLFVVTICLVTTICDIYFTKKENSSLLLAHICSNCCQLPSRAASLLIVPFPYLLLVYDFKLFSMVLVPDNVYSTDSLQLSKDIWQEDIKCIFIKSVFRSVSVQHPHL